MKTLKSLILAVSLLMALPLFAGQAVDINTADAEQIAASLDGVGQVKAEAIVAYRDQHGAFRHADEMVNVNGIGLRTVERNRDYIRLQGAPSKADRD